MSVGTRLNRRSLLALVVFFLACGPRYAPAMEPPPHDLPLEVKPTTHYRVLLIGDTGLQNDHMDAVRAAVQAETKDVIVALGDIVYPEAPPCPNLRLTPSATKILDHAAGATLLGLGAPVLLVLGNHDVKHGTRDPAREACILHYAATKSELVMSDLTWVVDAGVVTLVGLNTNALDDAQASMAARALEASKGWTVFLGHHVLKTYHDKVTENVVRPWLARHKLSPDLFANAHAHLHQLGVYDGVVAVTSGATALPRARPSCPPDCGSGQLFGSSKPGYALLDFTARRVEISFHDTGGTVLHRWTHEKGSSAHELAPPATKGP
jgi:predicted phosphodiesterase